MKNFFSQNTLDLWKKYTDNSQYSERTILKKLAPICLEHGGYLPFSFDISISYPDKQRIIKVLKDLGYGNFINVSCYGQTVYINLS